MTMNWEFFCSLVLACVSSRLVVAAADERFTIAENGQPRCVIAVAAKPSPAERDAASELQAILQEVTGTELPIRLCSEVARDARQIVVGPSARLAELLPGVKLDKVRADGIVIRTVGDALVLAGPRSRGTLYAVYTFVEDQVGCRWWTPTESTIPRKPTLSVPPLAITYAPKLKIREALYRDALEQQFAVRQKLNGHHNRGAEGKSLVVIMVQDKRGRAGRIRLARVANASRASLVPAVSAGVAPGSTVTTDGWTGYEGLSEAGYTHVIARPESVVGDDLLPLPHLVASLLKRWILGTYQGSVSPEHLDYYLDEFTFRFNRRTSASRGKLFYRLVQQAAQVDPVPVQQIIGGKPPISSGSWETSAYPGENGYFTKKANQNS